MRAVVQRVTSASVEVDDEVVGKIGYGLLVFLAAGGRDGPSSAKLMARKLASLRIFSDELGKMNLSALDIEGEVLVVSQFTLFGDVSRGNRPSFAAAATPNIAEPLIELVASELRASGINVQTGRFRALMRVQLTNDGPVTIILDV